MIAVPYGNNSPRDEDLAARGPSLRHSTRWLCDDVRVARKQPHHTEPTFAAWQHYWLGVVTSPRVRARMSARRGTVAVARGCACARVGCAGACANMGDGPPPPAPQHTSSNNRLALMLSNGTQRTTRRARIGVGRAHAISPPPPDHPRTHTHTPPIHTTHVYACVGRTVHLSYVATCTCLLCVHWNCTCPVSRAT